MRGGIERGISTEGVLPGKLRVPRRAAALRRMLVSQDKTTTDPMAISAAMHTCAGLAPNSSARPAAAIEHATPTSPWQPTSAPEIEAFIL